MRAFLLHEGIEGVFMVR